MATVRRVARNLLLIACLGAVAGYAVAKAFVWYEAYRSATRIAEWLAPHATVSWESVSADVDGEVRLQGLSIVPNGIDDEIYIDLLTVYAPGQPEAVTLIQSLRAGELPETLRIGAQGLMLNVDGPLYRRLADSYWWGTPVDGLGCGDVEHLRSAVLEAIDRRSIEASLEFRLRLHKASGRLALYLDMEVPGLAATTVDAMFTLAETTLPEDAEAPLAALSPVLTSLRVRYADLGFNEARNYYCAALLDVPVESFIDRHMTAVRDALSEEPGAVPEAAVVADYRAFATYGGDILVDFMPAGAVSLDALRQMDRAAFVAAMRPRLAINGRRVPAPAGIWLPDPVPAAEPAAAKAVPAAAGRTAVPIAAEELAAHVGAAVRIETRDGTMYTGVIEASDADMLTLRRRLEGGYMSFSIAPLEIERIVQLRPAP